MQAFDELRAPSPQRGLVVGEEEEIIDVAQIARAAQFALDEVVERIEVDVGPELAGEVTDWQAAVWRRTRVHIGSAGKNEVD